MKTQRVLLTITLLAVLLAIPVEMSAKTVVTVWRRETTAHLPWYEWIETTFEKNNPDIDIEYVTSGGKDEEFLLLRAVAGELPMITDNNHASHVQLVQEGVAVPLSTFADAESILSRYSEFARYFAKATGPDGVVRDYFLPASGASFTSAMNTRLVNEMGLSPANYPKYWDQWVQWSQRLSRDTNGDGILDTVGTELPRPGAAYLIAPVLVQLHAATNNWTFKDGDQSIFRTQYESVINWFDWVKSLVPYSRPVNYVGDPWAQGKQGLIMNAGSYNVAGWQSTMPDVYKDIEFFPLLQVSAQQKEWHSAGLSGFLMWNQQANTPEKQKAAWEVLKFITSPESLVKRLEVIGEIPAYGVSLPQQLRVYQPFLDAMVKTNATAGKASPTEAIFVDYYNVREKLVQRYTTVINDQAASRSALDALINDTDFYFKSK